MIQALYSVHLFRFKQFVLDIILMQVVVLLLVLGLCSVEGMRKRKRNRNQQQGRRGGTIYILVVLATKISLMGYWSCGNGILLETILIV